MAIAAKRIFVLSFDKLPNRMFAVAHNMGRLAPRRRDEFITDD